MNYLHPPSRCDY